MAEKASFVAEPGQPTIVTTRVFDAPRSLVFEALTRPEHVARWYGPQGFTNPICVADLRPGGAYRVVQLAPDGGEHAFRGVYRELSPLARLVRTWRYEPWPDGEAVETLELKEHGGRTTLTWSTVFPSVALRDGCVAGAREGGLESLDRLAERLGTMRSPTADPAFELVLTRVFDAPRALVFEAWSRPEHMKRWFAPRVFELSVCEMEFRAGGSYRWCMSGLGMEHWSTGVYREIVPLERIVLTGGFPGGQSPEQVRTVVTFADQGAKTRVTVQQSMAMFNAATEPMAKGAPQGWGETLDQLGEHVVRMKRERSETKRAG